MFYNKNKSFFRNAFLVMLVILLTKTTFSIEKNQYYKVKVKGIACSFCVYGLEKSINKIKGVDNIKTNLKRSEILIFPKQNAKISNERINQAIVDAGYEVKEILIDEVPVQ